MLYNDAMTERDTRTKIEITSKGPFGSLAEVSSTLTIQKFASLESGDVGILGAKRDADRELDRYFPRIHPYITRIEAAIIRELCAIEGFQVYLIRVYVTCPLHVVQEFHTAAGVQVEIPQEQIRYKPA